jgi:hypothetical protein
MSLDLPRVLSQVSELGATAAERRRQASQLVPRALQSLQEAASVAPHALQDRLKAAGERWRGAQPTDERLDQTFLPPAAPSGEYYVIGADGSQLYPDRHAAAYFFVVNVGSLAILHGSGQTPVACSLPRLYFRDEDLTDDFDYPVEPATVNALRDIAEMHELARRAEAFAGQPALALLDNGLLLWLAVEEGQRTRKSVQRLLTDYQRQMQALRASGAALAGVIDQPRSGNVLALLHLASLGPGQVDDQHLRANPYRPISDAALFSRQLPLGHRSARFVIASPLNRDFEQAGHQVQFFYLNAGHPGQLLRVEIPEWVAANPAALELVHAALLEQCRHTGIPYVLVRAHELAVVTQADRQSLESLVGASLIQHGIQPQISQKALTKRWTSQRRRHHL